MSLERDRSESAGRELKSEMGGEIGGSECGLFFQEVSLKREGNEWAVARPETGFLVFKMEDITRRVR